MTCGTHERGSQSGKNWGSPSFSLGYHLFKSQTQKCYNGGIKKNRYAPLHSLSWALIGSGGLTAEGYLGECVPLLGFLHWKLHVGIEKPVRKGKQVFRLMFITI